MATDRYFTSGELAKHTKRQLRHAGLDPASSVFSHFRIPACTGMMKIGLFCDVVENHHLKIENYARPIATNKRRTI